jgi:multicomponent Na+:H+ antiporter subunit D
VNDSVMTLGLFAVAGIIAYQKKDHTLKDFTGAFQTMPFTMTAFVVIALSIIGVPPTGGFFSKWYLIHGAVIAQNCFFLAALLGSSLINVILFFRIFEIAYGFHEDHGHGSHGHTAIHEAPLTMLVPTCAVALGILAIGFYNQSVVRFFIEHTVPRL